MIAFRGNRILHQYVQTNCAAPEQVFPLLCPVREADWLPGWQYRLIYSDTGVAEAGCVFTTPNPPGSAEPERAAAETTWIVTDYDPVALRIGYLWVDAGRIITELRIQLERGGEGETRTHIRYRYTGLSPEGNRDLERYTEEWFASKMRHWETAINHYLRTGRKLAA
ncbi:MAG TPA: hypothetical protein VMG31_13180 [Verrucomicrobiae bacterium]|nr:hypothetical protein [Verrucomicrobiae bacterium]